MNLGQYLRSLRIGKNITSRELGRNIGYSYSYICNVEKGVGKPSDKFISRFIKGVSADDNEIKQISNHLIEYYDIHISSSDVKYFSSRSLPQKLEFILLIDCELDGNELTQEDKKLLLRFMRSYMTTK